MENKKRIKKYYEELDRSYFIEEDYKDQSHLDRPIPIGHGQTISQPSLVLEMTLLLDLQEDSRVLEIGTGSGYQTALLSKSAKEVYTVERIEDLYKKAKKRLGEKGYSNISFKLGDGSLGWEDHAPYDRIMVTAAAAKLPEKLVEQLAANGKMVIPVGEITSWQELLLIEKDAQGKVSKKSLEKVRFVELVEDSL